MRKILTEAFSVNLIIVVMLFILGSYAVDQNKGVNTFGTGPSAIYKAETEEKNISLMINIYQGEESITGEETVLFAPPSGDVNAQVVADASSCGCQTIMWTADTIDWRDQDVSKIYARVERNLKPGVFVLMHPTQATLEALPEIILLAKSQGYTFMTVGEQLK